MEEKDGRKRRKESEAVSRSPAFEHMHCNVLSSTQLHKFFTMPQALFHHSSLPLISKFTLTWMSIH